MRNNCKCNARNIPTNLFVLFPSFITTKQIFSLFDYALYYLCVVCTFNTCFSYHFFFLNFFNNYYTLHVNIFHIIFFLYIYLCKQHARKHNTTICEAPPFVRPLRKTFSLYTDTTNRNPRKQTEQ